MPGIQEVAREAGVSISTVSRVLNQAGNVAPEKVARVMAAVEKLGYRPNVLARSLVTRKTQTLGLVIPDIENPTFPAVARGAEDEAYRLGFTLFLCNSDEDRDKEQTYLRGLMQKQVDGVLITSIAGDPNALHEMAAGVPIVQVGRLVDPALPAVVADNQAGGKLAARHLFELGHRRLAFVSGPPNVTTSQERLRGAMAYLAQQGVPEAPELLVHTSYDFHGGYSATVKLIESGAPFTALIGGNDLIALGAISALKAAGRRVPEDVSVVGFDNIPAAELVTPGLTSVSLRSHRMGAVAVGLLVDLINGKRRPTQITLGVKLAVRGTTGPCPPSK